MLCLQRAVQVQWLLALPFVAAACNCLTYGYPFAASQSPQHPAPISVQFTGTCCFPLLDFAPFTSRPFTACFARRCFIRNLDARITKTIRPVALLLTTRNERWLASSPLRGRWKLILPAAAVLRFESNRGSINSNLAEPSELCAQPVRRPSLV